MTKEPIVVDCDTCGKICDPKGTYITYESDIHFRDIHVKKLIHAPRDKDAAHLSVTFAHIEEIYAPETTVISLYGVEGSTILTLPPIDEMISISVSNCKQLVCGTNGLTILPKVEDREKMPDGSDYVLTDGHIYMNRDVKGSIGDIIAEERQQLADWKNDIEKEYDATLAAIAKGEHIAKEPATGSADTEHAATSHNQNWPEQHMKKLAYCAESEQHITYLTQILAAFDNEKT